MEIIPELADLAAGARIVRKRRYSAFFETDLAAQLQELQPEEVVVMGDCTDICVLHTVSGLRNRDYRWRCRPTASPASTRSSTSGPSGTWRRFSVPASPTAAETACRRSRNDCSRRVRRPEGENADVYFRRTAHILDAEGLDPVVVAEVFARRRALLCGMREVHALLREALAGEGEIWSLEEGTWFEPRRWFSGCAPRTAGSVSTKPPCSACSAAAPAGRPRPPNVSRPRPASR